MTSRTLGMDRLSITAKIWLSLGILVVGMVLSTALNQQLGLQTEASLRTTVDALFPVVQQSEKAEKAFDRAMKAFSAAVLVQDTEKLDDAAAAGREIVAALQAIVATPGLPAGRAAEAQSAATAIQQFLSDAQSAYREAVGGRQ